MTAISLTAQQAHEQTGIGKTSLYAAAKSGDMEVHWVGSQKWVVEPDELRAWIKTLPTERPVGVR